MSNISDLLSRLRKAGHKTGVPPGLAAGMGASRARSSRRFAVLVGASAAGAVVLGILTLFVVGSMKDDGRISQPGPAEQPVPSVAMVDADGAIKARPAARPDKDISTEPAPPVSRAAAAPVEKAPSLPPGATVKEQVRQTQAREQAQARPQPPSAEPAPAPSAAAAPTGQDSPAADADRLAQELYLARKYEQEGDRARALASYRKVLEIDPANYRAMNNVASLLLEVGSTGEAVRYLGEALGVKGGYVPALVNMGIALARQGDASGAEDYFKRALSIEPASLPALLNMAILCENSGRKEEAREFYGRLRVMGHPQGAAGLDRLR